MYRFQTKTELVSWLRQTEAGQEVLAMTRPPVVRVLAVERDDAVELYAAGGSVRLKAIAQIRTSSNSTAEQISEAILDEDLPLSWRIRDPWHYLGPVFQRSMPLDQYLRWHNLRKAEKLIDQMRREQQPRDQAVRRIRK